MEVFKAEQRKVNSARRYMPEGMCMCRCALFASLSPCAAVFG